MATVRKTAYPSQKRNLNPTAPAIVARSIWGKRYSEQRGGTMDFWDSLSDGERRTCFDIAEQVRAAPMPSHSNQ